MPSEIWPAAAILERAAKTAMRGKVGAKNFIVATEECVWLLVVELARLKGYLDADVDERGKQRTSTRVPFI